MSEIIADLFVEDRAHEEFIKALIDRIARQERKTVRVQIRSARGGHGCVLDELSVYQRSAKKIDTGMPDILFIAIDANCKKHSEARKDILGKVEANFATQTVIACPDPHIERWYLSDPESFAQVVGIQPSLGRKKCERDFYKKILAQAIISAKHPAMLGGIEFARELVDKMDFYRAGKNERSLGQFIDDATLQIRSTRGR